MKKLLFVVIALSLFSCKDKADQEPFGVKPPAEDTTTASTLSDVEKTGKEIFNGKGNCHTCHKPSQKAIGPSIAQIANIYAEKDADMTAFLRGDGEAIVDPSQYDVMKTNFYITKKFSDEEMQSVVDYVMTFKE